jgi:hypothetical protein
MLAQLFNPTEIKKNGPATRPATAPARRSALPFRAALAVLPATSQSYGDARVIVNGIPGPKDSTRKFLTYLLCFEYFQRLRARGGRMPGQ